MEKLIHMRSIGILAFEEIYNPVSKKFTHPQEDRTGSQRHSPGMTTSMCRQAIRPDGYSLLPLRYVILNGMSILPLTHYLRLHNYISDEVADNEPENNG
jgi:hypothetical protein